MDIFKLPDLGEGLPDAEIHEWFVKVGDEVTVDEPLVSMETAKAVVDVPCPQSGIIAKLYGGPGDVIKTGEPLMAFAAAKEEKDDKGTVVGNLEESTDVSEDTFTIGSSGKSNSTPRTTPNVRMLAKKLGIELSTLTGTGDYGMITRSDVEAAAKIKNKLPDGFEPLKGVRRAMLNSMQESHSEVVAVSIFDEADISQWKENTDITIRLIQAIVDGCKVEPALNAWFNKDHNARKCFDEVNLGLAMDNDEGLFVPVMHNVASKTSEQLRTTINEYKKEVFERSISADKLKGATITLSNFGKFAGRFASPIIVVPMVAILAVGRLYEGAVSSDGNVQSHKMLPLSLSFDHRAVTGGEATRFLGAVMKSLQQP
ncbi:MAG: dihydrolipoamide acetyltransferase family protein [Legionellaceae bacterium]|nr:dihydrolipoamide acetyltransferase family protein [Legionellaceae bacterium]